MQHMDMHKYVLIENHAPIKKNRSINWLFIYICESSNLTVHIDQDPWLGRF